MTFKRNHLGWNNFGYDHKNIIPKVNHGCGNISFLVQLLLTDVKRGGLIVFGCILQTTSSPKTPREQSWSKKLLMLGDLKNNRVVDSYRMFKMSKGECCKTISEMSN